VSDDNIHKLVAIKIQKSARRYTEAALDEIQLLYQAKEKDPDGGSCVVQLLDHFFHEGPHGKHVCLVFEVMGKNLLWLIKKYNHRGIPLHHCKILARQMLISLDFLHTNCHIIHTDVKPENFLLAVPNMYYHDELSPSQNIQEDISQITIPTPVISTPTPTSLVDCSQIPFASVCFPPLISPNGSSKQMEGAPKLNKKQKKKLKKKLKKKEQQKKKIPQISEPKEEASRTQKSQKKKKKKKVGKMKKAVSPSIASLTSSGTTFTDGDEIAKQETNCCGEQKEESLRWRWWSENLAVKIADLGNACWLHKHFTDDVTTREYRSPEVIVGYPYSSPIDVWSLACLIFELVTGDYLFKPKEDRDGRHTRDEDHLALMKELLGEMPRKITHQGKYSHHFFKRTGEFVNITNLEFWPLQDVLLEKYKMSVKDAKELTAFLLPMLNLDCTERATAGEMLKHPWLQLDDDNDLTEQCFDTSVDNLEFQTVDVLEPFQEVRQESEYENFPGYYQPPYEDQDQEQYQEEEAVIRQLRTDRYIYNDKCNYEEQDATIQDN